ncbi:50 kDa gamma-zein-like [Helianthus annuus]|uniref:50 kDa gamma-zein-like n=1 Tax=Helianthus annuus TaxID=4232 RepID=UPI000B8F35B7|nr:50 kDa gamma-zein-like [Helianthus annuus]
MGLIVELDRGDRLKGLNNEVWDPLPPDVEEHEDEEMHDQEHPAQQHQPQTPPHSPQHHAFHQHQEWPEFYQQFQQMRMTQEQHGTYIDQIRSSQDEIRASQDQLQATQDQLRQSQGTLYQGLSAGFSYLFGEMHLAYPDYFQHPPQFPPWNPPSYGDAGPSFTRDDDGDDA